MIIFKTVTKQFGPESYGLRDASFSIHPGELVCLTGPSGSGKTTVMRLLTKEYAPTAGEIIFQDTNLNKLRSWHIPQHRRRIGVVFQDYRLLPELNVWENIALPLSIIGQKNRAIEERVTDLLRLVKLEEKADLFPSQLSGGEAQRISIARALAMGPEVIFADEPTGNLDAKTAGSIARLFAKINELGTTILLATHDPVVLTTLKNKRVVEILGGMIASGETESDDEASDEDTSKDKSDKPENPDKPDKKSKSRKSKKS